MAATTLTLTASQKDHLVDALDIAIDHYASLGDRTVQEGARLRVLRDLRQKLLTEAQR